MWIKVCGIRDRETALALADLEIDAIGLNFYARSPRSVSADEAREISRVLPAEIARVGVFVNHSVEDVARLAQQCTLDIIQLHGDESPAYVSELQRQMPETDVFRAWRMPSEGLAGLAAFLEESERLKLRIAGCLVDANVAGVFGGSGATVDWCGLRQQYQHESWPPLILAGGLTPVNIANAVQSVQPWGVDVASGVESSPGVKNLDLVRQFVANARRA